MCKIKRKQGVITATFGKRTSEFENKKGIPPQAGYAFLMIKTTVDGSLIYRSFLLQDNLLATLRCADDVGSGSKTASLQVLHQGSL